MGPGYSAGYGARVTGYGAILRAYLWSRVLGVGTGLGTGLGLRDSGYGPRGTEPGSGLGSGLGTGLDYRTWVWAGTGQGRRGSVAGLGSGPGIGVEHMLGLWGIGFRAWVAGWLVAGLGTWDKLLGLQGLS